MTSQPVPPRGESWVGPYRLLAPIGEGGMGVVHLAQGPDGRRVALKVLRPHVVGDVEARERLAQEVASLRRIHSPRVAEILDADPHGPLPYVVTRYVPGLSLYHHVKEEGVVEGPALRHFARVLAEGLQAVHAAGVLHRDVKPTNVLMEGRWPVLIDFGLARVAEDPRLTQTGFLLGTPGYLAPEILYGDDASPASDLHSWAATTVFAAAGRSPYGTGPTMAVLDRVRRGEHDLAPVPDGLRQVLTACLSPEPADRPALGEVLEHLGALEDREAPRAAPAPEPVPWTMPFHPEPRADATDEDDRPTRAVPLPLPASSPHAPPTGQPVGPTAGDATVTPLSGLRAHAVDPYERPDPPTTVLPAVGAGTAVAGPTTSSSAPPWTSAATRPTGRPDQPWAPPEPWGPAPPDGSRLQQRLQLVGLGAVAGAAVAYAPYLGLALVALVVLGLRTVSVARQRHGRRRLARGAAKWYDVPVTALGTPGYVAVAAVGTCGLVALAALVGLSMFSVGYLAARPVAECLTLAGAGFAPMLWWGPWADRVRETVRRGTTATSRSEWWGWFVAATSVVLAAVLLALLFGGGPNWAPALAAPWR